MEEFYKQFDMHTQTNNTDPVEIAAEAFVQYRKKSAEEKAIFLEEIAEQILA